MWHVLGRNTIKRSSIRLTQAATTNVLRFWRRKQAEKHNQSCSKAQLHLHVCDRPDRTQQIVQRLAELTIRMLLFLLTASQVHEVAVLRISGVVTSVSTAQWPPLSWKQFSAARVPSDSFPFNVCTVTITWLCPLLLLVLWISELEKYELFVNMCGIEGRDLEGVVVNTKVNWFDADWQFLLFGAAKLGTRSTV